MNFLLNNLFEFVELLDNILLTLVQGTLHLLKVDLGIKLAHKNFLRLKQIITIDTACHFLPDVFKLLSDVVRFLLLIQFALGYQLVDELGSLFYISFSFVLQLL